MLRKSYEPAGSSSGAEYHRRTQDAVREALYWKERSKKNEKELFKIGQQRTHLLSMSEHFRNLLTEEKKSSKVLKNALAEERQAKWILLENNDCLRGALAEEKWANGVLQKDNDCLKSALSKEQWANGVLQKDNDYLKSALAEEQWANGVLQKDNDCLQMRMDHLNELETMLERKHDFEILKRQLYNTLHSCQRKAAARKKELKNQQERIASLQHRLEETERKYKDRVKRLTAEKEQLQNEIEGYKQRSGYPVPAYVPMLKENIANDRREQACNRKALPLNDSGINCDYIGDDNDLHGDKVKIMDKDETEEIVPTEEKAMVKLDAKGFDSNSLTVAANVKHNYSVPTKSKDSDGSVYSLSSSSMDTMAVKIGSNMRDELIIQLKAEINHLTTFSTDETERLEKVGMWIQKICEEFCPHLQEIERFVIKPLTTATYNTRYWHEVFSDILGVRHTSGCNVMELFSDWLSSKCSYPKQWKSLIELFATSGIPQLESMANFLQVRLHELIASQRLSSVETTGTRKRCISCSSFLRAVQEQITIYSTDTNAVDPFDVDEVFTQEETPFSNPTEAQV